MPSTAERALTRATYELARRRPQHEQHDFCGPATRRATLDAASVIDAARVPSPEFALLTYQAAKGTLRPGAPIAHDGRVLKQIPGAGWVYDWRGTAWTAPNGGRIRPLIHVVHIPVIPQMAGIADLIRLNEVLTAQGLRVHAATDKDGNVALYAPFDRLCYHARGANQQSCGTENIHLTVNEPWSKRQLRAQAWIVNLALEKHGIPAHGGTLTFGSGAVRVLKRGQVSHARVSDAAGFHDRSDPGSRYDWEYVRHCVIYWREKSTFEGA